MRRPSLLVAATTRYDGEVGAPMFTVPNLLSGGRLVLVPGLFVLAWQGRATLFLSCFTIALLSDVFDGWFARRLGRSSDLGTKLDSWADVALCLSVPLEVWWLWPDLVRHEAGFIGAVVAGYVVPALFALSKYHRLPSYHTWVAKLAGVLMGTGALILLAGGPTWPFHFATFAVLIEALEEMTITAILPRWRSNVPSFWHALVIARQRRVTL